MTIKDSDGSPLLMQLGSDAVSIQGEVYSYTILQDPPAGFAAQAPYHLALVRLNDGNMIVAQLTDVDCEVQIGDPVEMATRKLTTDGARGIIVYGYKFRPLVK